MELTKEQQELIDKLIKIDNFNTEFEKTRGKISSLFTTADNKFKDITEREERLKQKEWQIENNAKKRLSELAKIQREIETLIKEKTISFPWLATAISDYLNLRDEKIASFLSEKSHPAPVATQNVRRIAAEKRILTKQLLIARYRLEYYETLFPFLTEYNDESLDEILIQIVKEYEKEDTEEDPVKQYITSGEFIQWSETERNQKALERWLGSRKSNYQIGRDYERYIGYLYWQKDFKVNYHGIIEGYEDLGRDLICSKENKIEIIQCKFWSRKKIIHEKHINQLFGTTVEYYIKYCAKKGNTYILSLFPDLLRENNIKPVFYTSTMLSETARRFAAILGIEIHENEAMPQYPIIKCHINKQTGTKIYHLPFDQMYDRTILEKKHGEFYAMTIAEAEQKGYRRAWKWTGEANE